jgi:hypothetical protein
MNQYKIHRIIVTAGIAIAALWAMHSTHVSHRNAP